VAYSTVSRILRDHTVGYRPETVERVRRAAEEVGYRPNTQARGLRLQRHHAIALMVPDLDNFGFTEVLRGVQETCNERAYTLLISEVRASRDALAAEPRVDEVVDGALVAFALVDDAETSAYVRSLRVPTVFVQRGSPDAAASAVLDEGHNADLMIEHLAGLGHRRIGHVSGWLRTDTGVRRRAGFEAAMCRHGCERRPEWQADGGFTFDGGRRATHAIMQAAERPTALAVDALVSALGVLTGLRELGLRVPDDVSVITIDEHVLARQTTPPLTTVDPPQRALGRAAAQMLLDVLDGGVGDRLVIEARSSIVHRASTAPLPTGRPP
jgi:DNA-binding LacI/PurR family transcriptional regulator